MTNPSSGFCANGASVLDREVEWRRVCDWKQTVLLVDLAEVTPEFLDLQGLVKPEERLGARFPRLARLVASTRYVRVERALARLLHQAGVATFEVGYHRGSDGLSFAEASRFPRQSKDVDMAALVGCLTSDETDEDEYDRLRADAVDAVLRILSEGLLTERAVIVAALAPPLSSSTASGEAESSWQDFEALDARTLPDVEPEFVERVAAALSEIEARPRMPPNPALSPDVRRAYQRKALVMGLVALAAGLIGMMVAPVVAVFSVPVLAVCSIIVAIHAMALKVEGSAQSKSSDRR